MSMLLGVAPVGAADAADLGNSATAAYDGNGNLTIGNQGTVAEGTNKAGKNNTTIGTDTDTLRNVKEGDTTKEGQPMDTDNHTKLVDGEGQAHNLDEYKSTESGGSTAVGYNNKAEGDSSTAIGNDAKIINKPITYYADKDGNKTTSTDDAAWYKDSSGNPTEVPQVFRDADGNTTTTPQYVHTYTVTDPNTGVETTKTEITSDNTKADQKDGKPVYNYQKSDNLDKLYSVTLYQAASNSIAAGSNVTANGSNAVAVGYQSTADNSAVAVGDAAVAKENGVAIGKDTKASVEGSIALGKGSEADRSGGITGWDPKTGTTSVKTGTAWQSGAGALSIGNGSASRQITNVAAGSEDSDAVNLAQLKEAMIHYYSVKTTEATDAAGNNNYLNDGATGDNALAAGVSAVAKGNNATAVGTQTYASGENASAYGYRSVASGPNSLAIGSGTSAQQEGSVAVGGHAQGYYAVQVGTGSTAQSAYSVAVGGHAKGDHSVEVGYGSTAQGSYSASVGGHAIGNYSIAIGSSKDNWGYINAASAAGDNSIAIGGHTNSANNIAIGSGSATSGQYAITVGGHATSNQAVSIGGVATNSQAIAVGYGSSSTGSQSTAVGGHAGDTNSTAVGQGANANYAYATAVGNSSVASGDHSTALGYGTSVQGSSSTAIGGASAKGSNVTAIGKNSTVGGYWSDSISDSTVIGGAHISGSLTSGTAIGSNASVTGSYGVALGQNASVAYQSTGVGTETKASNTGTAVGYGAQAHGNQSASVGAGSKATGQNAVALGGSGAWGDYSIALGSGAGTTAHAIALGWNSGAWGESAIAIGEGSNAWRANSIVLGKNSKSGADKNIEGYDPRTGVASVDDTSTWQSTDEAVSIGRAEERDGDGNITATAITRQLNNLAAGTLDTDAVNVAQLKAATQKVNVHDYSVWSPDTETDTNYTNEGAVAKNSMAAGVSASTTKDAENAVAIGYKAKAEGYGTTVIGQYASATGRYALAFGGQQTDTTAEQANNMASGDNAVSFGERTTASGANATAFGQETKATEKRATAFGQRTQATKSNATAFGIDTTASGQNATAFGNLTQATEIGATAFGNKNQATGQYATAWGGGDKVVDNGNGTTKKVGTVASGTYATAFGERTVASGESATAFGSDSTASGKNSLAFGENSTAAAENSLAALGGTVDETATNAAAIGSGAQARLADSIALGNGSVADRASGAKGYDMLTKGDTTNTSAAWVSNANAIAVGNDTDGSLLTRQITGVAAGSLDTDAVNVAQLKAAGLSFTTNTKDASNTTDNYKDYKVVSRRLGDTIAIKASDEADNHSYSTANLTTRIAENGDISILMDEKPTFTSVTTGDVIFAGNPDLTDKDGKAAKADTNVHYGTKTLTDSQNITSAGNDTQATRLHYKDDQGHTYEVATMDDGQTYAGDVQDSNAKANAFSRKLNEQTNVVGGVTNLDDLSKENNVGVVSNGTDTLTIRLAKKLTDLTSVTTVTTDAKGNKTSETVQNGNGITITPSTLGAGKSAVSLTDKGLSNGGNQITHVDSGLKDATGNPVDLATASGDVLNNAVNVGDLKNVQNAVTSAHTAVTVNGEIEALAVGADGKLGNYTDKEKGNLLLAQKKDTTTGKITYDLKLNDNVILGKNGTDGQEGTIGLTGKDGLPGTDGKQGYSTTIIKTEKGQAGKDGKIGKENLGGTDITRIVYTDKDGSNPQTVATLSDGLNFAGDDISKTVAKKLNETLQIRGDGTYDKEKNTVADDGNIKTSVDNGAVKVSLSDKINLHQDGYLTVGGSRNGNVADGNDPIVIKHFNAGALTVTGTDKEGKTPQSAAGDYVTGLDNKNWNVENPTYVSGRAATEDQLKKVSDAVNKAASTAGKHTVVTVNDKDNETTAPVGTDGSYGAYSDSAKGNLLIAAKDENGKTTYNIKLNDNLTIGQKGADGQDGKDGNVTVDTKGGTTVVIGHDGEPGKDGKDGISVKGKDGKDGVTITAVNGKDGTNGTEGHIGLTGPAGKDGKPASADIHVKNGQNGVDGTDGNNGKDGMDRIVYEDHNGKPHEVATMDDGMKYVGNFGAGASVKLNKTVNIKGILKEGTKKDDFVDGNIAVVANKNGDDAELLIKLNKDLTGLNSATYTTSTKNGDVTTTSTTVVDGTGLKIDNGPSITNTGINGGSKKITNVAAGTDGTDAVNVSQLNAVKTLAGQHTTVEAGSSGNVTVTPGENTDGSKKYTVDLAKDVTFGKTSDRDKTVAISGTNGTVTAGTDDNKVTVDGSKGQIVAGGDSGVKIGNIAGDDSSLTIYKDGKTTNQTDKAGKYVTNLDNKTWNTDGSYVSGRAATEDQLHQLESSFNTKVKAVEQHHTEVTVNGGDKPEKADGSYTKGNLQLSQTTKDGKNIYDLKLSDNLSLGTVGKDGAKGTDGSIGLKGADGKSSIGLNGRDGISVIGADGKNGVSITGSNGLDGKNGIDGKIAIGTPGKDGQPGKDAVSISGQNGEGHIGLTGTAGKDGKDAVADIHVKNGQVGVDSTDGHGGKDGMDRIVYEDHNGTPHEVATMDDGMKYGDDFGNTAKVKLNHQLDIVGDINAGRKDGNKATKDDLSDGNIGIIATDTTYNADGTVKENGRMTVKLAKDLKDMNSITIKGDDNHKNITIQQGNINMGGNKIENVAPGRIAPDSTDAVNGSQLYATNQNISNLGGEVNKLGTRVNRVGANAAALAALHPLDFDPDDKWDFAAGYGNYKNANAAAIGAYYRPNEDTMFSVGGSFGGGENMVNAGISVKLGQGNHVSTSRVAMAKEIKDLRKDVADLKAVVNQQSALIDKLTGVNAGQLSGSDDLFPDVPANHWAYEYVTKLRQAGILTGYPDGNFAGDRMMTRYEFAAIVYRAIMAGAAANPNLNRDGTLDRLAKEFSGEMKYIRIDTIRKDRNGKPTIQRVRVIKEEEK